MPYNGNSRAAAQLYFNQVKSIFNHLANMGLSDINGGVAYNRISKSLDELQEELAELPDIGDDDCWTESINTLEENLIKACSLLNLDRDSVFKPAQSETPPRLRSQEMIALLKGISDLSLCFEKLLSNRTLSAEVIEVLQSVSDDGYLQRALHMVTDELDLTIDLQEACQAQIKQFAEALSALPDFDGRNGLLDKLDKLNPLWRLEFHMEKLAF